jgi:hypothetical protein
MPPVVAGTPASGPYFRPMQRLLTLLIAALVVLLAAGTLRRSRTAAAPPAQGGSRATVAGNTAPQGHDSAWRAARALLARNSGQTYLDSLLISTDSLVRRWPDRGGTPLRIALLEGGSPDYGERMAGFVREAAGRWEAAGTGWRFGFTGDSANADIVVRWRTSFGNGNQAGVTDLRWTNAGPVRHAYVALATRNEGDSLFSDQALLGAAIHELGHAMGLPHSADSADVMYPITRVTTVSERDRATARLLYALPPGSLRDQRP